MAVLGWNVTIIDGKKWLVVDLAKPRVPLEWDPSSGVFLAVSMPDGGILNHPALVQGDPGPMPEIDQDIDLTPLAYENPTADFASFVKTAPGIYRLRMSQRRGPSGPPGGNIILPADYGVPAVGWYPAVKALDNGSFAFELVPPPVGGRFGPAKISSAPTGIAAYTLCPIQIPAQQRDCYARVDAQTVITGTGDNVRADLIARLDTGVPNAEFQGPVVARGFGIVGRNPQGIPTNICSARPPNSGTLGKIAKGTPATVFIRVERIVGTDSFSTLSDTTVAEVWLDPVS